MPDRHASEQAAGAYRGRSLTVSQMPRRIRNARNWAMLPRSLHDRATEAARASIRRYRKSKSPGFPGLLTTYGHLRKGEWCQKRTPIVVRLSQFSAIFRRTFLSDTRNDTLQLFIKEVRVLNPLELSSESDSGAPSSGGSGNLIEEIFRFQNSHLFIITSEVAPKQDREFFDCSWTATDKETH